MRRLPKPGTTPAEAAQEADGPGDGPNHAAQLSRTHAGGGAG